MDIRTRKHIERSLRVVDFARQHPSDLPGYQDALGRLQEGLGRVAEAAAEEFGKRRAVTAAIAKREALRREITAELRILAGLARTAGVESVGTPIVLRYPGPKQNQVEFVAGARRVLDEATAQEELLLKYGLPAGHLDRTRAGLEQLEDLQRERDEAGRTHVGARLRLFKVVGDMRWVVEQLHSINLFRFRNQPDLLGMWRSARSLRLSGRRRGDEAGSEEEVPSAESLTAAAAQAQRALPAGGEAMGALG